MALHTKVIRRCVYTVLDMELWLLLCVISFVAGASADSPNASHYDTIVIGLGTAGTTAASELAKAGRRVLALDAQSHVGGRVYTVPFGDGVVEIGAEWIHGNESSRTYELAIQHNIIPLLQTLITAAYRSDGSTKESALAAEIFDLDLMENLPNPSEPFGISATRKLKEYLANNKPKVLKDEDFVNGYLDFWNSQTNNCNGCNDWNDVPSSVPYELLGGPQTLSWHRHGYKTFLELMLNTYKRGPGLSNLEIKLNTEVTLIKAPEEPSQKVIVECKDGSSYEADTAIVTVSLGVLKAKHSTLFSPILSKDKQTAIDKISMGIVDKIIFQFDKVWWPKNVTIFAFIWKGDDKKKVSAADYWTTRIFAAHPPMGSGNTLTLWTNGEGAKEVETLPEEVVKAKCIELLQRFVGDSMNITVPQPSGMIRSAWYTNPFTRGSYSYDSLLTSQYPEARAWLGRPLVDSSGAPRVLFAGEATNLNHYRTVHGASETGYREAMRLLNTASTA